MSTATLTYTPIHNHSNVLHDELIDAGTPRTIREIDQAIQLAAEHLNETRGGRQWSPDSSYDWNQMEPHVLEQLDLEPKES